MYLEHISQIVLVCAPVFMLIGLGKWLGLKGLLSGTHREVINRLVYQLSLPALIFRAVIKQPPLEVFDPAMIVPALLPMAVMIGLYLGLARLRNLTGGTAAAFVFGTFWANVSYMGFPLSQSAFGDEGLRVAANYNAVVMPCFVITGILLISFRQPREQRHPLLLAKRILLNPVLLSAISGIAIGALAHAITMPQTGLASSVLAVGDRFLYMVGSMGLPLALLSIGSGLQWHGLGYMRTELSLVMFGKLLLLPFLTLLATHSFYPDMDPVIRGITVLMSTTPNAVASYVIGRQCGVDEHFLTAMLVGSTLLSLLAIPSWLYFVL